MHKPTAVSAQFNDVFQDNLRRPNPLKLDQEIAQLRTLLVEIRTGIDKHSAEQVRTFLDAFRTRFTVHLRDTGLPPEWVEMFLGMGSDDLAMAWSWVWGPPRAAPSKEEIDQLNKTYATLTKLVETYKKIEDGIMYKVEFDHKTLDFLKKFIVHVVYPFIAMPDRGAFTVKAEEFFSTYHQPDRVDSNFDGSAPNIPLPVLPPPK